MAVRSLIVDIADQGWGNAAQAITGQVGGLVGVGRPPGSST